MRGLDMCSTSSVTVPAPLSDARAVLETAGRRRLVAAGEVLVEEGEASDAIFVVLAGQLKMCRSTPGGRNLILALMAPGDVYGVAAALGGQPSAMSLAGLVASEVLVVRRQDLYDLLARQPELLPRLMPLLTRDLRECRHCIVEASCSRVEPRFAHLFRQLVERHGEPMGHGSFLPLPLSRQELADLAGTTLETAIRVMSRWGKLGIVATRPDGFVLPDLRRLDELAEL